ncbi:MAG: fluoride efflux transporter CrcB [Candidatus Cyclobacteriaceae bacterium M3_2C_046]
MEKFIWVALGGALGSAGRYWISGLAFKLLGTQFPYGTLAVNLLGSFIIGLLWVFVEELAPFSPGLRMLVFIGFLGGFTTFSSYALETLNLIREHEYIKALNNVIANNILGLLMVIAGFFLARWLIIILR